MPEYITKEQVMNAMGELNLMLDDIWGVEEKLDELPPADVIERPEMFARLMNEFNVVDIDEDTGECTINDNWVSIIDVLDTIDGMRAEGTESIWGENKE